MSVDVKELHFKIAASLVQFLPNGNAKMKLAILVFFCCEEFVKNRRFKFVEFREFTDSSSKENSIRELRELISDLCRKSTHF